MSVSQEWDCQRFQEIRQRLDRLKEFEESSRISIPHFEWNTFQQDWQDRWARITNRLKEIDGLLRPTSPNKLAWDASQPAVLQFAPREGVLPMGPF